MPSEQSQTLSGRCYCGAVTLEFDTPPETVAYCHCADCKRWTGSPLPAFAAFAKDALTATSDMPEPFSTVQGVRRWICKVCGSPLAAAFDYLPNQIYVPIGVLDQAGSLAPQLHCHAENEIEWLHLHDGLPRTEGSARAELRTKHDTDD